MSVSYELCSKRSADTSPYTLVDAIFEGDDIIDYLIDSGPYGVTFSTWLTAPLNCPLDLEYTTRVTKSGAVTTDLSAVPTIDNLLIDIDFSVVPTIGFAHTVTVLAMTPAL